MVTAIIGTGKIGTAIATDLTAAGQSVVLASRTPLHAAQLAGELGASASAADVADAIERADTIVFAVWLAAIKNLLRAYWRELPGRVVLDPSNPVGPDGEGGFARTLPDGVSSASVIASLLPSGTHYVKAFGTVSAETLASQAHLVPDRGVLFYATDDDVAAQTAERLISAAGFDPVKAGGVDQAIRIEMYGDLHQFGGLNGKLITRAEAEALLADGTPLG
jgi:8-hydroxy-5-deazaflavin:NADPH oxidoreductase